MTTQTQPAAGRLGHAGPGLYRPIRTHGKSIHFPALIASLADAHERSPALARLKLACAIEAASRRPRTEAFYKP